jgi:hypothetical protein
MVLGLWLLHEDRPLKFSSILGLLESPTFGVGN